MNTNAPLPAGDLPPRNDRMRILRAFNASLAAVLVLVAVFALQDYFDWRPWAVSPLDSKGLLGLIGRPLLHGSVEHIASNAITILILGTLAGSVYPKATVRALPLLWIGSGLGAWMLGDPGSFHLGASGVTHGLMFLLASLGLLRRDRATIATGLIGMLFYGGMLMTVLPRADGVSWRSHMSGAFAGVIAALLFRRSDPLPPRQRYSWEDEEDEAETLADDELEPPSPPRVPVLWQPREGRDYVVIPFRRPDEPRS
ncbi:MAG: hypothetical protein GAK31_03382 [Stenotrophomonas maltophilia]|uniref:Peptidase S54 rhomboid domain-containing protein n=1 Tax=Stenotrophomonas maltophilia TaxID=40324 RepID=A0A7V8JKB7_STEMA|nr:MAG: hypothetical protein GAK31_03382 [Stenotrophomonas maltophilia]